MKINGVFQSYKKIKRINKKNEVIIQEMVNNVILSGVITTCDKDFFSPYYIVNFLKSKDTSKITSGSLNGSTFVYYKFSKKKPKNIILSKIIELADELTKIKGPTLDIEFAFDKNKNIYLLQVREVVKNKYYKNHNKNLSIPLFKLTKKISKLQKRNFNLFGKTNLFGVMPDWNPAEMIGLRPAPLASSLYGELITNDVWAQDRKKFGYLDVTSHELLNNFFGISYVDLRIDFNSWIPNDLDNSLAEKLVNFYLNKYKNKTEFHDKIEFNIVFTCFTFSTDQKLKELLKFSFNKSEIKKISKSLKKITRNSFKILNDSLLDLEKLNIIQNKVLNSKLYEIDKIYWLIQYCKKFGTSSFASIARCAFIANDFLNSLVENKIFSIENRNIFLQSIKTIVSEMNDDLFKLNKKDFIKKYGHLRPSTYDIGSLNYKEAYHIYFSEKQIIKKIKNNFKLTNKQYFQIKTLLKKNNLNISVKSFFNFIKLAISQREKAKFYFSKNIDLVFQMLIKIGKRNGIARSDLAFIDIRTILELHNNLNSSLIADQLKKEIRNNKIKYQFNHLIKLPQNILRPNDVFFYIEKHPKSNFMAPKDITAPVVYIEKKLNLNLKGKIVCIESADPGYDYIFSKNIKGLITMFGGVNSHMSIRCSELGIPAAIGVGENLFRNIKNSRIIRLNTKIGKIDIVSK